MRRTSQLNSWLCFASMCFQAVVSQAAELWDASVPPNGNRISPLPFLVLHHPPHVTLHTSFLSAALQPSACARCMTHAYLHFSALVFHWVFELGQFREISGPASA